MERKRTVGDVTTDELKKAYESNKDFKEYVDKSKFSDNDVAFQNAMVKYYYLYLLEKSSE